MKREVLTDAVEGWSPAVAVLLLILALMLMAKGVQ